MDYGFVCLKAEAEYEGYYNPITIVVKSTFLTGSSLSMMEGVKEFVKRKNRKIEGCACRRIDFRVELSMPRTYNSTSALSLPDGSTVYSDGIWMYHENDGGWTYRKEGSNYHSETIDDKEFNRKLTSMVEAVSKANAVMRTFDDIEYNKRKAEQEAGVSN